MSVLNKIPSLLKIYYIHSDYATGGYPLCRVLWDNKQVANFKADGQEIDSVFCQIQRHKHTYNRTLW